jgi:hypothetical protein
MEEFPGPVFLQYAGKKHTFYLDTESGVTTLHLPEFCLVFDPVTGDLISWPAGTKITVRHEPRPSTSPRFQPAPPPEGPPKIDPETRLAVPARRRRKKKQLSPVQTNVGRRRVHTHTVEGSTDRKPPRTDDQEASRSTDVKRVRRHKRENGEESSESLTIPEVASTVGPSTLLGIRPFSTHELLHGAFGLPLNYDRQQLLDELNSNLRIKAFAEANFRRHTVGAFRKTPVPIDELISFASHPLKKPLLKNVPANLKGDGAHLSQYLLEYTGVHRCPDVSAVTKKIIAMLRDKPPLVDDFYFQLIKQTTNNTTQNYLISTWGLFLIIATLFPAAEHSRRWIRGHIARAIIAAEPQVAEIAALTYIRFDTRDRLGPLLTKDVIPDWIDTIPKDVRSGLPAFGCSLYEMMFRQRAAWPRLPIPRALHYIVLQLKAKGCMSTEGIFATPGHEAVTDKIRAEVNKRLAAIDAADLRTLANLLRAWLQDLPNPVVPLELTESFQRMCEAGDAVSFVDQLPPVHKRVLLYVIGFVKELIANAQQTKMEKSDFAFQFGTRLVSPQKHARGHTTNEERLRAHSVSFFNQIVDAIDTSSVYPIPDNLLIERSEQAVQEHFRKLSTTGQPDDWLRDDAPSSPADA